MEIQNSKDWAKVYRACNFIEKGVCEYADERVYLSEETLLKSLHTIKGRPVIIDHMTGITPENMNEHAVGYVVDYEAQGACDCKFVVFDDEGKKVIADGYSVSCAYKPKSFGPGGTWHNVPYDREITDLEYTHLALVQNPRYEDAKVYENAKDGDDKGRWITIKGTHVFIKDGQSVEDAMKEHGFGKSSKPSSTGEKKSSWQKSKYGSRWQLDQNGYSAKVEAKKDDGYYVQIFDSEGHNTDQYKEFVAKEEAMEWAENKTKELSSTGKKGDDELVVVEKADPKAVKKEKEAKDRWDKTMKEYGELNGKYAKEDADFDVEQMKKDIKTVQSKGYESVEDIAEFLGLDEDEVRETMGEGDRSGSSEKHNSTEKQSKEENMKVDEFFNKMGEMIEEKLNACKSKMNESEEQDKEDDDKIELDGEVYSKKELVNAWKEKKNAEESKEKSDEQSEEESREESEEKQNSGDEFFNAMEKRMQQQMQASDKIEVYSQQKGIEKGKSIYGG